MKAKRLLKTSWAIYDLVSIETATAQMKINTAIKKLFHPHRKKKQNRITALGQMKAEFRNYNRQRR